MSKPRHKQRQRRLFVPLMGATHGIKALELHLYVESAITEPSFATMEMIAIRLGAITAAVFTVGGPLPTRTDAAANAIRQMQAALEAIDARFALVEAWGASDQEAADMRAAAGVLDGALKRMPFNVLRNAERFVDNIVAGIGAEKFAAMIAD